MLIRHSVSIIYYSVKTQQLWHSTGNSKNGAKLWQLNSLLQN